MLELNSIRFCNEAPPHSGAFPFIQHKFDSGKPGRGFLSFPDVNSVTKLTKEQHMCRMKNLFLGLAFAGLLPLAALAGPVDINTADAETLSAELKGVGLSKAKAIVEYREANGPFDSATDLAEVKGIGARTVEINKDNILVKPESKKPH